MAEDGGGFSAVFGERRGRGRLGSPEPVSTAAAADSPTARALEVLLRECGWSSVVKPGFEGRSVRWYDKPGHDRESAYDLFEALRAQVSEEALWATGWVLSDEGWSHPSPPDGLQRFSPNVQDASACAYAYERMREAQPSADV